MRQTSFHSVLAPAMNDFVAFQRAHGYAYDDSAVSLGYLDRFLVRSAYECDKITGDVELAEGRLTVRRGKLGKSRNIALSGSAVAAVGRYLDARLGFPPNGRDAPFFINGKGGRLNYASTAKEFKILLRACGTCDRLKVDPDKLSFDAIDDQIILDFLDHLETERGNVAATRNQRLAAIKTFFRFLARHEPMMLAACELVCAIRAKNVPHKVMETLDHREVKAIFNGIASKTAHDARDRALLSLMYNTGARVQELIDLDAEDIRMEAPFQVKLVGKGRKERITPLHKETVDEVGRYLRMRREAGSDGDALFLNDRGERLSRHGALHIVKERVREAVEAAPSLKGRKITPHSFRHTTALHLIQAGVDIIVVKEWLGHADVKTTSLYVEINIEMKRKALDSCPPPTQPGGAASEKPNWRKPGVMKFLQGLSRASALC